LRIDIAVAIVISIDVISGPQPAEAPFGVDTLAQDALSAARLT